MNTTYGRNRVTTIADAVLEYRRTPYVYVDAERTSCPSRSGLQSSDPSPAPDLRADGAGVPHFTPQPADKPPSPDLGMHETQGDLVKLQPVGEGWGEGKAPPSPPCARLPPGSWPSILSAEEKPELSERCHGGSPPHVLHPPPVHRNSVVRDAPRPAAVSGRLVDRPPPPTVRPRDVVPGGPTQTSTPIPLGFCRLRKNRNYQNGDGVLFYLGDL